MSESVTESVNESVSESLAVEPQVTALVRVCEVVVSQRLGDWVGG